MEATDRLAQMRESLIRQANENDPRAQKLLREMGISWQKEPGAAAEPVIEAAEDYGLQEILESLNDQGTQNEIAAILSETQQVIPEPVIVEPALASQPEPTPVAPEGEVTRTREEIAAILDLFAMSNAEVKKQGRQQEKKDLMEELEEDGADMRYLRNQDLRFPEDKALIDARKNDYRELSEALKSGEITEDQREILENRFNIEAPEDVIVVASTEPIKVLNTVDAKSRIDPAKEEELQSYLDMPDGSARRKYIDKFLEKGGGARVSAQLRSSALEVVAEGERQPSVPDIREEIEYYKSLDDPEGRIMALRELAKKLTKSRADRNLVDEVNALVRTEKSKASTTNLIGGPRELIDNPNADANVAWLQWARMREVGLVQPGVRKNAGEVFQLVVNDPVTGKRPANGLIYMPESVNELLDGGYDEDGRPIVGEIEMAVEMGLLYTNWRKAHKSLGAMSEAYDPTRGGDYKLPNNRQCKFFLNDFSGIVRGRDGKERIEKEAGAKNIAKALQIYWAMAHFTDKDGMGRDLPRATKAKEILIRSGIVREMLSRIQPPGSTQTLEERNLYVDFAMETDPARKDEILMKGLGRFSIYNNQLVVEEVDVVRGIIASQCGGPMYEAIGQMYAGFYGISAWGSTSISPGIADVDKMGLMIHTKIQRYVAFDRNKPNTLPVNYEKDRLSEGKRAARFLDDSVANNLVVLDVNGKSVVEPVSVKVDGRDVIYFDYKTIELAKHSGTVQELKDEAQPKFFYIVKPRGSAEKYKIIKALKKPYGEEDTGLTATEFRDELGEIVAIKNVHLNSSDYEEIDFDTIISDGRINEIDWENSIDLAGLLMMRERNSIGVYNMYKKLEDPLEKLTKAELQGRKEVFGNALPNYNQATVQNAAYVWLHSLINKPNNLSWRTDERKKAELNKVVDEAEEIRLISEARASQLRKDFGLGMTGELVKPLKDQSFRPDNLMASVIPESTRRRFDKAVNKGIRRIKRGLGS